MDVEDGVKRDEGMEVIPSGITRRRRSRIDVTDTQAYKDLYANNLRLYGFLLQKEMDRRRNKHLKKLEGEYFQNHVTDLNARRNNRLLSSFRKMKDTKKSASALDLSPRSDSEYSDSEAGSVDNLPIDRLQVENSAGYKFRGRPRAGSAIENISIRVTDDNASVTSSASSTNSLERMNIDIEVTRSGRRSTEPWLRPRGRTAINRISIELASSSDEEPDFIDDDTTPKIKVKAEYLKSQFTRDEDQRRTRLFTGLQTVKTSPKFASAVELVPHSDSSSDDADSVTMAKELQNSTLIPTGSRPRSRTAFELGYSSDNKYDRVSMKQPILNKRMIEAQERTKNRYARMRSLEGVISKADEVMRAMKRAPKTSN